MHAFAGRGEARSLWQSSIVKDVFFLLTGLVSAVHTYHEKKIKSVLWG